MPWKKGQSGNPSGRKPGAKNALSEGFLRSLEADWKENGKESIRQMRKEDNTQYVKMVASLVPKDYNVNHNDMTEATYEQLLDELRQELEGTGISAEGLVAREGDQVTH